MMNNRAGDKSFLFTVSVASPPIGVPSLVISSERIQRSTEKR